MDMLIQVTALNLIVTLVYAEQVLLELTYADIQNPLLNMQAAEVTLRHCDSVLF